MAQWTANTSGRPANYIRLTVTQGSQNIANNTTNAVWSLDLVDTWGSWSAQSSGSWTVNINGTIYTGVVPPYNSHTTTRIASGTTVIPHNADGTKTMGVDAAIGGVDNVGDAGIGVQMMGLTTIPRASDASVSGGWTFTAGSSKTINIARASSSFTHNITYKFGSLSGTIATAAAGSQAWAPPTSLLTQIPNAIRGNGTITVQTKNGSTVIGSKSYTFTLEAGASAIPSITGRTLSEGNSNVASSPISVYIQGESSLKVVITASGYEGSTITSRTFTIDGVTANTGATIDLNTSGTRTVVTTVTDSRGRVATASQTISVVAYAPPQITSMKVRRANSNGTASDSGQYIALEMNASGRSVKSGTTEQNTLKIEIFAKLKSASSWGAAKNVINHTSMTYSRAFSVIGGGATYLAGNSYDVLVKVTDVLNDAQLQMMVNTASIFMHWSNTGVGIGKYHERGVLDVNGHIYGSGNLYIDGIMASGKVPNARLEELSPGLTIASGSQTVPGNNCDLAIDTGFYVCSGSTANTPSSTAWYNLIVQNGGSRSTQYASPLMEPGLVYKRWNTTNKYPATWSNWVVVGDERSPELTISGIASYNAIGQIGGQDVTVALPTNFFPNTNYIVTTGSLGDNRLAFSAVSRTRSSIMFRVSNWHSQGTAPAGVFAWRASMLS